MNVDSLHKLIDEGADTDQRPVARLSALARASELLHAHMQAIAVEMKGEDVTTAEFLDLTGLYESIRKEGVHLDS